MDSGLGNAMRQNLSGRKSESKDTVARNRRCPAAGRSSPGRRQAARRVAAAMRDRTRAMSRSASSPVAASA